MISKAVIRIVQSPRFRMIVAIAIVAAALAYVVGRVALSSIVDVDFRHFWKAGHVWASGGNPYSADYFRPPDPPLPGPKLLLWAYPPQIWLVARPIASLEPQVALTTWRLISVALIVGSCLLVQPRTPDKNRFPPVGTALLIGSATASYNASLTLAFGQISPLIMLGAALVHTGLLSRREWPIAAGTLLLLLKPQVGLVLVPLLLAIPHARRSALAGGVICILVASIPLLQVGIEPTIRGLLSNMGRYDDFQGNLPENSSGLANLASYFGMSVPLPVGLTLAFATSAWFTWQLLSRGMLVPGRRDGADLLILGALAATSAFVQLHFFDLLWLALAPAFSGSLGRRERVLLLLAAAVLFRSGNVENAIRAIVGAPSGLGDTLSTLVAFVMLGIACSATLRPRR